jgi:hypothetical protein
MSIEEIPSIKHMREQMRAFKLILVANRALNFLGLGSKKIAELQRQYDDISVKMKEYTQYPTKFNRYFSKEGWLAHDTFEFSKLRQIVDLYEAQGSDTATKMLLDYYSPDNIADKIFFFIGVEELCIRKKFIELALEDYKAKRYHAVVPLLLMIMDGAMNDAVGKGLHAEGINLDIWDSLTTADGAINDIKEIFQRGRRKTRTEEIAFPYRNGILHGMDLGYDNKVVAAKSWCFLFVVRDWISAKKSEPIRRKAFDEETRTPTFREIVETMAKTEKLKQAVAAWSAREISEEYIQELNQSLSSDEDTPEHTVFQFLEFWKKRNFGGMAELFWSRVTADRRRYAGEVRLQFSHINIVSYSIKRITDEASAITEVFVDLNESPDECLYTKFRMLYEDKDGDATARGIPGGTWRIVSVNTNEPPG